MRPRGARLLRDTAVLVAVVAALTVAGGAATASGLSRRAASRAGAPTEPAAAPEPTPSPSPGRSAAPLPAPAVGSPDSPFQVVGLGDSVPAGSQCGCTSYVSLVGEQAARQRGRTATVTNLARNGLTTPGLAAQLEQSAVRTTIADADLVIVTIGANDFDADDLTSPACQPAPDLLCYRSTLAAQRSQLSSVLGEIGDLQADPNATVLVTGYWNVFLDGAVGRSHGTTYVAASDALTRADNALIAAVSNALNDTYVDIYQPFKGDDGTSDDTALLAADGDHPNAAGHALIARTLLDALG